MKVGAVVQLASWVIFPQGVNWFYERAAQNISDELRALGVHVAVCGAAELLRRPAIRSGGTALIVSVKECVPAANPATLMNQVPAWGLENWQVSLPLSVNGRQSKC